MKRTNILVIALMLCAVSSFFAATIVQDNSSELIVISGKVIDSETSDNLVFATIGLQNSNLATVSNSEGDFIIKIPREMGDDVLEVSFLGHKTYAAPIASIKTHKQITIRLEPVSVSLSELNVFPNDPHIIINNVLNNIQDNYSSESELMTAFYRETIKKGRHYTALSEAVVEINKPPYLGNKTEQVRLLKGRKGINVSKMDTVLFKLQGGAHSMLSIDIVKYPYFFLSPEIQDDYNYKFETITLIDDELHLVISFRQKDNIDDPLFFGKLYIHAETMAISSATFSLNTENRTKASNILIRKKPMGSDIYPVYANYIVNYRRQGDKYYYSYSRGEVNFKIDWDKRLFKTNYITLEKLKPFRGDDRIKNNAIMSEEVSEFYDKDFWGEYNVIEPEKSINTAIKKIARSIEKLD